MKAREAETPSPWCWRTDGWLAVGLMQFYAVTVMPLLFRSLWHDEIVTLRLFAQAATWREALWNYAFPNNHPLHTALVRLAVGAFGPTEWAIRLPALLGGCLLLAIAYAWLSRHCVRGEALLYAGLLGLIGPVLGYALHARGYSLTMAFSALALMAFCRYVDGDRHWRWLGLAWGAAVLAVLTIPVALLLCLVLGATQAAMWVVAWRQGRWKRRRFVGELAIPVVAAALIAAFYLPVLGPLREASQAGPPGSLRLAMAWLEYVTRLPGWLAIPLLIAAMAWCPWGGWSVRMVLGAVVALPLLLVGTGMLGGPERAMLFALPAIWCLGAGLVHRLIVLAGRLIPHKAAVVTVAIVGLIVLSTDILAFVQEPNGAVVQADGGDWKEVVASARASAGDLVVTRMAKPTGVIYPSLTWYLYESPDAEHWQAQRNRDVADRLRNGLTGELTVVELAFRDLWHPPASDGLNPWADAGYRVFSRPLPTEARSGGLRLTMFNLPEPVAIMHLLLERAMIQQMPEAVAVGMVDECLELRAEADHQRLSLGFAIEPADTDRQLSFCVEVELPAGQTVRFAPEGFVRWGSREDMALALAAKANWQAPQVSVGLDSLGRYPAARALAQMVVPLPDRRYLLWGIAEVPAGRSVVWLTAHFRQRGESLRCRGVTVTDYGPPSQPGK